MVENCCDPESYDRNYVERATYGVICFYRKEYCRRGHDCVHRVTA